MENLDKFILAIKNFFRYKSNFFIVFILIVSSTLLLFSFSYFSSLHNYWKNWQEEDRSFYYYSVNYLEQYDRDKIIEKVQKLDFVKDIYSSYAELSVFGYIEDFVDSFYDGLIELKPIPTNYIPIYQGIDVKNDYELLCPSLFFPTRKNVFNSKKTINLSPFIGKEFNISIYEPNQPIKFKLVGTFDSSLPYETYDTCYTTKNTIRELLHNDFSDNENRSFIVLVNDKTKINEILNITGINNYENVTMIDYSFDSNILKSLIISSTILFVLSSIIIFLIFRKRSLQQTSLNGLMYSLGFSKKHIRQLNLIEVLFISLFSIAFSFVSTLLCNVIYEKLILSSSMIYFKMNISISIIGILFIIILNIVIPFIACILNISKIDKVESKRLLYTEE